jgi:hypothetical protein
MKANLTYSLISADLKQGMYLLVNDHLGYVSRMNGDEAIISFYFEDGKVIKLAKQTMTREDAIRTYGESVIKLIAIVDGNPISINHQNYKKIFVPMLTFAKGAEESYISQFIKTKEWSNPIYGDISPVYSMLKVGDVVNIISLPIVDAYSLYDPMNRLVRVKSKKGNSKYIVVRMDNECEYDFEITVDRTDVALGDKDKYDLFNMNFDVLKNLVANGEAKTVEAKGKTKSEANPNGNAFYRLHKSKWKATYSKLEGQDHYQWLAVREEDEANNEAKLVVPISVPITNIPKHQFSGFDNEYWIPGTIREMNQAKADLKNFVPFREGLPIFGKLTTTVLNDKEFTYFLLDNIKQESVNHYIFKHRDITEERRSELTIKKLPTL